MEIRVFATADEMARAVAGRVADALRRRPALVLGVPAGRSPIATYAELARLSRSGEFNISHATAFALDEFVGIDRTHPASFHRFLREHFAEPAGLPSDRLHTLNGVATDLEAECLRYEQAIQDFGGIDLQLLGLGSNGHVGFNEPASELIARTHRVTLLEPTRKANAGPFDGDVASVPREALTMGIGTILKAERVILLASGESKSTIVERMVRGPIRPQLPASLLQTHRAVELYLDQAAAACL